MSSIQPGIFRFRQFSVRNERSALKVGTDAVLLGAAMTFPETDRDLRLLDIGTGTGVIALMAAQRLCDAGRRFHIEAIDIDLASAQEAADNFAGSPWAGHLSAIHCPLQDYQPTDEGFDMIFSNPPFYDNSLTNPDAREATARHTESLSYREICAFAAAHLSGEHGRLAMILPAGEERSLIRTAASFGLQLHRLLRIRTTARKDPRRIIAEFCSVRTASVQEKEIILQDGNSRSEDYRKLTEEFYL